MNKVSLAEKSFDVSMSNTMIGIYCWMSVGLGLTGLIAYKVGTSELVNLLVGDKALATCMMIVELLLVIFLCSRIRSMSPVTAAVTFLSYAALNGVTLSIVFLEYTKASISSTFFISAATFATCGLYGFVTKRNLTAIGDFMIMGLIGIIIAMVVNLFLDSTSLEFAISAIGVIVFVALTAYDTQKLKEMSWVVSRKGSSDSQRMAVLGALTLYLDFLNLFLFLMRFLGVSTSKR